MKNLIKILLVALLVPIFTIAQYNPNGGGGGGSVTWPLTSPSGATIGSTAGSLDLTASGTNQNITLTPSGTGTVVTPASLTVNGQTAAVGSNTGASAFLNFTGNGTTIQNISGNTNIVLKPSGTGIVSIGSNPPATGKLWAGTLVGGVYQTASNCSSSASPAVCGSAAAGSFVIAASSTSVVVNTTAVTANSQILVTEDQSLGTKLGVTCNTGFASAPAISARTSGTSFTVNISASLASFPVCFSYMIIN